MRLPNLDDVLNLLFEPFPRREITQNGIGLSEIAFKRFELQYLRRSQSDVVILSNILNRSELIMDRHRLNGARKIVDCTLAAVLIQLNKPI